MNGTPAATVIALRRSATMTACSSFSMAQGPPMRTRGAPPPIVMPPTRTECGMTAGLALPLMIQGGPDEGGEQRMGIPRPRAKLGMELPGHEPRVIGELDDLHQPLGRPDAGDAQPVLLELAQVVVVDLVAVPVALLDGARAEHPRGHTALGQRDRVEAQAHGAALVGDPALLGQEIDHVVRGPGIELR